jgi:polyphosphate kinase 2 (PPK2 family)
MSEQEQTKVVDLENLHGPELRHRQAEMRHNPEAIRELFLTGAYPYQSKMPRADYEERKMALQVELLNPRGARVVALEKPSEQERGQWYFQRYVSHLPTEGEIVLFDRSWYNRAGVERVMEFCSPEDYLEFMRQTPKLERMMVRSGVKLFKYWFSVTREEQMARFSAEKVIRSSNGSCHPSTAPPLNVGMNTQRQRRRCSSIPIPPMPPGPS